VCSPILLKEGFSLVYLRLQIALLVLMVGTHAPAYLLMRGCCSDSKTRLQLSRHLFTPRISTKKSDEEKNR
jgi:hypothetical protein